MICVPLALYCCDTCLNCIQNGISGETGKSTDRNGMSTAHLLHQGVGEDFFDIEVAKVAEAKSHGESY